MVSLRENVRKIRPVMWRDRERDNLVSLRENVKSGW